MDLKKAEDIVNEGYLRSLSGIVRDPDFPEQDAFVLDASRQLAALCTRRAGKSNGLGLRFYRTLLRYPNALCPYIALTRESAKNIMWEVLQEQDARFKLGAKFTESNLTATLPNGGRIQLFGADMQNFIVRLKGIKTPGAGIDESQDFGPHLEKLVDDVIKPATIDYPDGWVALTGTAGPIPYGFFFDITHNGKDAYSVHRWGLHSNPYLSGTREFVQKLKRDKKWADDNPTYLREYGGKQGLSQWVLDLEALVFKYSEARNHFDALPRLAGNWEYVIGVDLGFDDADAIAVIGWNEYEKRSYLVEEEVQRGQGISELAARLEAAIDKYKPLKVVVDTAGLGKKIAEEMRRRYSLPVVAAEKARMYEFIELLNDAMRTKNFMARKDSLFVHDAARLKWDTESVKPKIADSFHSDICMAALYGFREALHWLAEPPKIKPKFQSPEWFAAESRRMEEQAEDQVRRARGQEDLDEWNNLS